MLYLVPMNAVMAFHPMLLIIFNKLLAIRKLGLLGICVVDFQFGLFASGNY